MSQLLASTWAVSLLVSVVVATEAALLRDAATALDLEAAAEIDPVVVVMTPAPALVAVTRVLAAVK